MIWHTILPKMWHFFPIKIPFIIQSPFAVLITSTLLGQIFTRWFWSVDFGDFSHSATKALARPGTDLGWRRLFKFIPKVFSRFEIKRLLAGYSSFYLPTEANNVFMDLALCTESLSWWNRLTSCHIPYVSFQNTIKKFSTLVFSILHFCTQGHTLNDNK